MKLKKFIEDCNSLRSEYMKRSPRKKWEFVTNFAEINLKLVGLNILDANFKPIWWLSYGVGVAIVSIFISFAYTMWYFIFESPVKSFLALPIIGVIIPVCTSNLYYFATR